MKVNVPVTGATVAICDRQPVFGEGLATLLKSEARKYAVLAVTVSPSELGRSIRGEAPDVILLDASFVSTRWCKFATARRTPV